MVTRTRAARGWRRVVLAIALVAASSVSAFAAALTPEDHPAGASVGVPGEAPGSSAGNAATSPRPALKLVWLDVADSAPFIFPQASRETLTLLKEMDLTATIRRGDVRGVLGEDELALVLVPNRSPLPDNGHHVLGAAIKSERRARGVWLYFPALAEILGQGERPPSTWSQLEQHRLSVALARIAVHEIVHALLPRHPHASSGLMSATLSTAGLIEPGIEVDAGTRDALRAKLAGIQLPESPAGTLAGSPTLLAY